MTALVSRQRISLARLVDLLRGVVDAHLHPSDHLVFVPVLGFRPSGTRMLLDRATIEHDETRLTAVAVAAAPGRTDVVVEWERPPDAKACVPGDYLAASRTRPPNLASAVLVVDGISLPASYIVRGAYGTGMDGTHAVHTMSFPPISAASLEIDLRVKEGEHEFRLPLVLTAPALRARRVAAFAEHEGITVRATSVAWHADELILGIEVEAAATVNRVGAPQSPQWPFRAVSQETRRARGKALRDFLGGRVQPIILDDHRGGQAEELHRIFSGLRPDRSQPTVQRFAVAFPAPASDVDEVTVVVPFVEVSDLTPSATVDLRALPVDIQLGANRLTVVAAETYGSETKVILTIDRSASLPSFVQPASFVGTGGSYSWGRGPDDQVWFAGPVGVPPIITLRGVMRRVAGPWPVRVQLK
jgi:hypothetical protein